jgi:hypothetical protein
MRNIVAASIAGITGVVIGAWCNDILRDARQSTYFEANDIENYFLKNSLQPNSDVELTQVVGSNWDTACFLGVGGNATALLDASLGTNGWRLKSGRVIDEGLLDYLSKVILFNADGAVYVMNFDERVYKLFAPENCHSTQNVSISRASKEIKFDPDGYGEHSIEYTISVKD